MKYKELEESLSAEQRRWYNRMTGASFLGGCAVGVTVFALGVFIVILVAKMVGGL